MGNCKLVILFFYLEGETKKKKEYRLIKMEQEVREK